MATPLEDQMRETMDAYHRWVNEDQTETPGEIPLGVCDCPPKEEGIPS